MPAYTFYMDSIVRGYQSIWDNPLADGDLLCEWEMGNSHDPQAIAVKRWSLDGTQLQVVGHVHKKYLPINLFDIHIKLCRCVKIWMVRIWWIFGQSSISPNFSSAKISLHTVMSNFWEVLEGIISNILSILGSGLTDMELLGCSMQSCYNLVR